MKSFKKEIPGFQDFSASIFDLPIDSFGMVVLRGRIEAALGHPVSDNIWGKIKSLNDILALPSEEYIPFLQALYPRLAPPIP